MVHLFKKLGFLSLLFAAVGFSFQAKASQVNVDVFPMLHPSPLKKNDPVADEWVMRSQYELMVYLQEHPDSYVFVESLHSNSFDKEVYFDPKGPEAELRDFYQKSLQVNFPNGVPFSYEQMSEAQKAILREMGLATYLMFHLGYVRALLPTNTEEEFQTLVSNNLSLPNVERLMAISAGVLQPDSPEEAAKAAEFLEDSFAKRERVALRHVQEFAAKNPEIKNIVLVYGKNHDFMKYRGKEEFADLNIRKVNTRRYARSAGNFLNGSYLNEPRFDNYRFDPVTQRYEMIPGLFSF